MRMYKRNAILQALTDGLTYHANSTPLVAKKGYVAGGVNESWKKLSTIDQLNFSTEATAKLSAALSVARSTAAGVRSALKGYFLGGLAGNEVDKIDGIRFDTDVALSIAAKLSTATYGAGGASSSSSGYAAGTQAYGNTIFKFSFSAESGYNLARHLSVGRSDPNGLSSSVAGYFSCGYKPTAPNCVTVTDKLYFSTDQVSSISATLTLARYASYCFSSPTDGYLASGSSALNYLNSIEQVSFTTDTISPLSATLSSPRFGGAGVNSSAMGYACGGYPLTAGIETLNFSTHTVGAIAATLTEPVYSVSGVSNNA